MKPVKTWILVADGARARVVLNAGPGKGVEEIEGLDFRSEHPQSGDIMADREGRAFDSQGSGRHAMERPSDPHRNAKKAFAERLAAMLDKHAARDRFNRLVIVAPPQALGDLRAALSRGVRDRVSAELAKDLTHLRNEDLPLHLAEVLAI
ncbi:MAG: host attachment protein [Hyphomicrobiales bacterium]